MDGRDVWSAPGDPGSGQLPSPRRGTGDAGTVTVPSTRPAAPQPPPSTWGAHDDGPGSPRGSVRPPDVTGTSLPTARGGAGRRGMAGTLLAALVGAVLGSAATFALARSTDGGDTVVAPIVQGGSGEANVAAVAEAVVPSVVRVDRFVRIGGEMTPEGLGSGVIMRSDGYIVTNDHVVAGADELEVVFADGQRSDATVVGQDPLADLAVIHVERDGLPAISVRDDPPVRVGEPAIAVGSPFGLDATVTAGVVSALNRSIRETIPGGGTVSIPNVIQTDAAINPGNSGGALVDARGRLIGINSAILTTGSVGGDFGNVGVGFAISALDASTIADALIADGHVDHARLGILGGDLTESVAREYGVSVEQGAIVNEVTPDGPADEAGVRSGDVIVAAGGEDIASMDQLIAIIWRHEPGDVMKLTLVRGEDRMDVDVTLGEWTDD